MDSLHHSLTVLFVLCLLQYGAAVEGSFAEVAPTTVLLHEHRNTAIVTWSHYNTALHKWSQMITGVSSNLMLTNGYEHSQ